MSKPGRTTRTATHQTEAAADLDVSDNLPGRVTPYIPAKSPSLQDLAVVSNILLMNVSQSHLTWRSETWRQQDFAGRRLRYRSAQDFRAHRVKETVLIPNSKLGM